MHLDWRSAKAPFPTSSPALDAQKLASYISENETGVLSASVVVQRPDFKGARNTLSRNFQVVRLPRSRICYTAKNGWKKAATSNSQSVISWVSTKKLKKSNLITQGWNGLLGTTPRVIHSLLQG